MLEFLKSRVFGRTAPDENAKLEDYLAEIRRRLRASRPDDEPDPPSLVELFQSLGEEDQWHAPGSRLDDGVAYHASQGLPASGS